MSDSNYSSGIGLTGCVFIVFLVLKLTGNISWSWWWVAAPLWMPVAVVLGIMLIIILVYLLKG